MQTKFTVIGTASPERTVFSLAHARHGFQVERVVKALEPVIGKTVVLEGHAVSTELIRNQRFIDLVKEGLATPELATHPVLLRYVQWYEQFEPTFFVVHTNPSVEIGMDAGFVPCSLEPGGSRYVGN